MICADSSAIIASIARWHGRHRAARMLLEQHRCAASHAVVETYSVLTRLPEPQRLTRDLAAAGIASIIDSVLVLPGDAMVRLPQTLARVSVQGGATYDGLIALTAVHHGATLLTLDERAAVTYRACGADFTLIGA